VDSTKGVVIMTDTYQLSDTFKPFQLPTERWDFGTRDNVEQLILLMRKLVADGTTIFYRHTPEGEYDSSDFCMGETTLFAYRKSTEYSKGFFREIGNIVTDSAIDVEFEAAKKDDWGMHYVSPGRTSSGCIAYIHVESPMGRLSNMSTWENCKLLLRTVAATSAYQRLSFPQVTASGKNDQSYIVRLWTDDETHQDLAKVTVNGCGRYSDEFAIELL